jgi:hypothetical protein
MTDCADLSDELEEEFGSIVDGLRPTLGCIKTDPVSDWERSDGVRGISNSPGLRACRDGAVRAVCGLGVASSL